MLNHESSPPNWDLDPLRVPGLVPLRRPGPGPQTLGGGGRLWRRHFSQSFPGDGI